MALAQPHAMAVVAARQDFGDKETPLPHAEAVEPVGRDDTETLEGPADPFNWPA